MPKAVEYLTEQQYNNFIQYMDAYCGWHHISRIELSMRFFKTRSYAQYISQRRMPAHMAQTIMGALDLSHALIGKRIKLMGSLMGSRCL